jgi:hypothetical protein
MVRDSFNCETFRTAKNIDLDHLWSSSENRSVNPPDKDRLVGLKVEDVCWALGAGCWVLGVRV